MVQQRRIILAPASNIVSHTGRCIELGRALKREGYEIIGVGSPKYFRNPQIVTENEFGYYKLPDFEQEEAMEALRTMRKPYTRNMVAEHVAAELALLEVLEPDAVIVDFRLTMHISARVLRIPIISLLNARWLPQYFTGTYEAPDSHPVPLFTKRILGRKAAASLWPHLIKLIQRYKLAPLAWGFRKNRLRVRRYLPDILVGDYNLILDTTLWGPTQGLPPNFNQVGPILWSPPESTLPTWFQALDPSKRSIYITMGSTGAKGLFQEMFKSFRTTEYQVMVSTGGQIDIDASTLSENLHVEQFLPGERIMERADMVICHGGSLTVYQAIKAGTPCIVIATHLDQEWAGEELQTHKAGMFLTMVRVMAKPSLILESTERMLANLEEYRKNMKRLQEDLLKYDGLGNAVSGITGFMESLPSS